MMPSKQTLQMLESLRKTAFRKKRKCMAPNCNETAINSHVLQKNGILKSICPDNHLYQFAGVPFYEVDKKGPFELKSIGIKEAYSFPGFCKFHDTEIFKEIEVKNKIENDLENSARLLSYRSICNEIRRKEIVSDYYDSILGLSDSTAFLYRLKDFSSSALEGTTYGLTSLHHFKNKIEKEIFEKKSNWDYFICEVPKFEICISAPLTIKDPKNVKSINFDSFGNKTSNIIVTSVINLFPFGSKNYMMTAINKEYKCDWTASLFQQMKHSDYKDYEKLISDLVSTRLEFWCTSSKVRNLIRRKNYERFLQIWQSEILNHNVNIGYDFNLFEN